MKQHFAGRSSISQKSKLVKPLNYDITLEPNLENFRFKGKEKIKIKILKSTNKIVLNSLDIEVKNCRLTYTDYDVRPRFVLDSQKEELKLLLPKVLKPGIVDLFIDFEGPISDRLVGLYRAQFDTKDNQKKYLATTQFEPTDARRVFPSWDSPDYKATFDVTLIADKNKVCISNMPIISEKELNDGRKIVKFLRTPLMSTYLLYFGVGEFEFIEDKLGKISLRVYTTPGKKEQGKFAMEMVKKFLRYYQDYFRIPYPLPKLDLVAIPDFASGAMENWGVITFNESAILYHKKTSSKLTKQRIAIIISHELAHQWFGNLVTMKWWNDLWLNESFASFIAYKAVAKFYPEWDLWSQFLNLEMKEAFELDSLKSSHPIEVEVKAPHEINEIFDKISYQKGGSILRMLENYLGEKVFRDGLTRYLLENKYGNVTKEDLWNSLEKVSGKPIRKMMSTWTKQTGYPMIEVEEKDHKIKLTQKKFLLEDSKVKDRTKWLIPISLGTDSKIFSDLLITKQKDIDIGPTKFFKLNLNQPGFYRVKYQKRNLEALKQLVMGKKLSNLDRWGLENDLFALLESGEILLGEYLGFIRAYENENDYLVCSDICNNLYFLYLLSFDKIINKEIKKTSIWFCGKIFGKLRWDSKPNEKHTDALLRSSVIYYLGRMDDKKILKAGLQRFRKFLVKPDLLNPDLRGAVYNLAAWSGKKATYRKMLNLYCQAETQEEKRRFLVSLAGFRDRKLLEETLEFSKSDKVRLQDVWIPIAAVGGNPYGKNIVWPWVKENWQIMKEKSGGIANLIFNRILGSAIGVLSDIELEREIKEFVKNNPIPGTERAIQQSLERLRVNHNFLKRNSATYS